MANKKILQSENYQNIWITKIDNSLIIDFKRLEGGVSSDVFKVKTKKKLYCIKRSLPKLRVKKEWLADTKRIKFEYLWLKHCKKIIPNSIPNVYKFSSKNHYLILEYLNENKYKNLKEEFLRKKIDYKIIIKISKDLFKIHKNSTSKNIKKKFSDNSKNFYDLRLDAYFNEVARVHPKLNVKIKKITNNYKINSSTLIHGDFSPKNMLVYNKTIKYIDAETCNYGDPAFDLVYFANHLLIKSIHIPQKKHHFINSYKIFFDTYLGSLELSKRNIFFERCVEMIPIMLLARVDGKSPVEYITKENKKNKIRLLAFKLIENSPKSLNALIKIIK